MENEEKFPRNEICYSYVHISFQQLFERNEEVQLTPGRKILRFRVEPGQTEVSMNVKGYFHNTPCLFLSAFVDSNAACSHYTVFK